MYEGRMYFWNPSTSETSWEPPKDAKVEWVHLKEQDGRAFYCNNITGEMFPENNQRPGPAPPWPRGGFPGRQVPNLPNSSASSSAHRSEQELPSNVSEVGTSIGGLRMGFANPEASRPAANPQDAKNATDGGAVSYTHLTLPTILRV